MVNELLSHLSNTSCIFKAFWQDFICLLTWGLHKSAGVCGGQHKIKCKPPSYTSNVCLFCCTEPGWISSPAPPAQAVLHGAAGETSLSLYHLTRRRMGQLSCESLWRLACGLCDEHCGGSWSVPVYMMEVLYPLRSPVLCFLLLCYLELQGAKQQGYENKQQLPGGSSELHTGRTAWEVQNKHTVGLGSFFTYLGRLVTVKPSKQHINSSML